MTLSAITRDVDGELRVIQQVVDPIERVTGRDELEAALARASKAQTWRALDLIGHATPEGVLQLGDWVIDTADPEVVAWWRGAGCELERLGIDELRLLGCSTAISARGRATVAMLADVLGLEVYGTRAGVFSAQFQRDGFSQVWRHVLLPASQLWPRSEPPRSDQRALELAELAAEPLERERTWPVVIATRDEAEALLALVRSDEGAAFACAVDPPVGEIALPADEPGAYRRIELVLDGAMIRVFPRDRPHGIGFPVTDPAAMRALVDRRSRRT
ncbi:MAG TPA: hypothetical protein VLX92_09550 [Kofleriaceae bacterium]|nr:hypothetical protein [Kofleriaceae bacterium]